MEVIKCNMCGGNIDVKENQEYGECNYCGSLVTLPKISDSRRANLFNRANHFRMNNEFDKAADAYENIINEDDTEAEAYWGLVLSKYGIEYVEDPKTNKRIPTVHRLHYESILNDIDYKLTLKNTTDEYKKNLYKTQAETINEIQKDILKKAKNEDPYDIFICYKETSEAGSRTKDSSIAQDIYYQLQDKGYKTFFSKITLENKLGKEYEPYIFSALNSAKVMVVVGTSSDNFNAVWVKNEWSRYLEIAEEASNKTIIPCYKDMDPYDMPGQLSIYQSLDMSKIGFIQDLVRGIEKIVTNNSKKQDNNNGVSDISINPLIERAKIFLDNSDFNKANEYFDRVLDQNPKLSEAYIGKLMAELKVKDVEGLLSFEYSLNNHNSYKNAIKFSSKENREKLINYEKERIYLIATKMIDFNEDTSNSEKIKKYENIIKELNKIEGYKDVDRLLKGIFEDKERLKKEQIYLNAKSLMNTSNISDIKKAILEFKEISHFKDSANLILECEEQIEFLKKDKIYQNVTRSNFTRNIKKYKEAISDLKTIINHKDSRQLIEKYEERIIQIERN
ncbi:MAG: toll/interleukin-1 receptor domain-containing protein, partial [Bacillota bacterium]|nr:toll/interleukin-1 receptor domain-containing protein [Bacillota bacterium]